METEHPQSERDDSAVNLVRVKSIFESTGEKIFGSEIKIADRRGLHFAHTYATLPSALKVAEQLNGLGLDPQIDGRTIGLTYTASEEEFNSHVRREK